MVDTAALKLFSISKGKQVKFRRQPQNVWRRINEITFGSKYEIFESKTIRHDSIQSLYNESSRVRSFAAKVISLVTTL